MKKIAITFLLLFINSVQSQVTQEWVARYNGPQNGNDYATALAIDGSGNIFVTGRIQYESAIYDIATIKYNFSGVQKWVAIYGQWVYNDYAESIAVDASGNVYVTGVGQLEFTTGGNYTTIKYGSSSDSQWVRSYNYADWLDIGRSIVTDDLGNVYVTGESSYHGSADSADYATIKYNSAGVTQWVQRYNGPGNMKDYATSIAVDNSGNVYVTGESKGIGTLEDFATIKYNASGVQQWVARYNGPGNNYDMARSLVVDASGNVYVTGSSRSGSALTTTDYATVKYNSSGVQQWVARYNGPGNSIDNSFSLAVDGAGNIFVTGSSRNTTLSGSEDYATLKYNSSGVQQWVQRYNGQANNYDGATALAIDNSGSVYVTGESIQQTGGAYRDYATVKYNTSGVQQWAIRYNGPGGDYARSIAVDDFGNVYVTGESQSIAGQNYDYLTIKYSQNPPSTMTFNRNNLNRPIQDLQSTADTISVSVLNPLAGIVSNVKVRIDTVIHPNTDDLEFSLLHLGINDTIIYRVGGAGDNFIGTILNDSAVTLIENGSAPFTGSYKPSRPLSQFTGGNPNGNWILRIYDRAAGSTGTLKAWSLILTAQSLTPIVSQNSSIPDNFALDQNYPNPFNPSTHIRFALPKSSFTRLVIYDITGREVETLVNEQLNAGTYEASWKADRFSSGLYFYKLTAGDFVETKRMILLK